MSFTVDPEKIRGFDGKHPKNAASGIAGSFEVLLAAAPDLAAYYALAVMNGYNDQQVWQLSMVCGRYLRPDEPLAAGDIVRVASPMLPKGHGWTLVIAAEGGGIREALVLVESTFRLLQASPGKVQQVWRAEPATLFEDESPRGRFWGPAMEKMRELLSRQLVILERDFVRHVLRGTGIDADDAASLVAKLGSELRPIGDVTPEPGDLVFNADRSRCAVVLANRQSVMSWNFTMENYATIATLADLPPAFVWSPGGSPAPSGPPAPPAGGDDERGAGSGSSAGPEGDVHVMGRGTGGKGAGRFNAAQQLVENQNDFLKPVDAWANAITEARFQERMARVRTYVQRHLPNDQEVRLIVKVERTGRTLVRAEDAGRSQAVIRDPGDTTKYDDTITVRGTLPSLYEMDRMKEELKDPNEAYEKIVLPTQERANKASGAVLVPRNPVSNRDLTLINQVIHELDRAKSDLEKERAPKPSPEPRRPPKTDPSSPPVPNPQPAPAPGAQQRVSEVIEHINDVASTGDQVALKPPDAPVVPGDPNADPHADHEDGGGTALGGAPGDVHTSSVADPPPPRGADPRLWANILRARRNAIVFGDMATTIISRHARSLAAQAGERRHPILGAAEPGGAYGIDLQKLRALRGKPSGRAGGNLAAAFLAVLSASPELSAWFATVTDDPLSDARVRRVINLTGRLSWRRTPRAGDVIYLGGDVWGVALAASGALVTEWLTYAATGQGNQYVHHPQAGETALLIWTPVPARILDARSPTGAFWGPGLARLTQFLDTASIVDQGGLLRGVFGGTRFESAHTFDSLFSMLGGELQTIGPGVAIYPGCVMFGAQKGDLGIAMPDGSVFGAKAGGGSLRFWRAREFGPRAVWYPHP